MNDLAAIAEFMKRSELFSELQQESLVRVARRMKSAIYGPEAALCNEGDPGDRMFIITRGEVAILKDVGWGHRELGRMGVGEVVGEMALISKERRSATVQAVVDTECLQLDQIDFDELIDQDSHFAQRVAKLVTRRLAELGRESSEELLHSYRALMLSLAGLAESRDPDTGAHLERVRSYCTLLAELLSATPEFRDSIDSALIEGIFYVSPLHDIGKVAIPDSILLKPDKLTDEEFEIMKSHTTTGAAAIRKVLDENDERIFQLAYNICLNHHERWDGSGYPIGFAGDNIPVEARIMAIADVYDVMLSARAYKQADSLDYAIEELNRCAGSQFDPHMIQVFSAHADRFSAIYEKYQDSNESEISL